MTGNLDMLMLFRDMQVAQDVGRMAELGRYDREFTCYGLMYEASAVRRYVISGSADRLYDQAMLLRRSNCWMTPIVSYSQLCHVPAGGEETIAREVKMTLARNLQMDYPPDFAQAIWPLAALAPTNAAAPLLEELRQQLDGYYHRDGLQMFAALVELAWQGKVLSVSACQAFRRWLAQVQKDMADDPLPKDQFERTFYGFAFERSGQLHYKINANRGALYLQKQALELEGLCTTPILAKTYWYNYTYRLADARAAFEQLLKRQTEQGFWQLVNTLKALPSALPASVSRQMQDDIQRTFSPTVQEAWRLLARQWHL